MFETILLPTDGSNGATVAVDHVLDIAAAHDATVHILNVADTTRDSVIQIQGDVVDVLEQEGEQIVRDAADRARQRGVTTVTEVLQGEPYSTILDYAELRDVDVIAMPTHGRQGLERLLIGSTTERVVRRADIPVLTIRPDSDITVTHPYRNVLVPTDGSDCAREALETGVDVATEETAALHLLSVVDVTSLGVDVRIQMQVKFLEENATEIVEDATEFATDASVDPVSGSVVLGTSIHGEILSYIDEHDVDLIVVGTHGRTGFDRYMLGSVTEKLVRTSPIPVLTVRTGREET
ncbi:universal stress protein [Halococcus saccharolyticus]|uniref:Universal stress protein uspa-like protein n=1 Tax=Halococcus saccharolyticus DSM 5350 TaxID=1227455 RepID=M0MKU0_9EURY|nr:universal stress protein [Halococcus saccharolyticus]EMA46317.1 universal stress protein uspa-like protein [Halococcus saccharolyticus DSM 5350]